MNILILNGSHRKNGNCSNFCQTAKEILQKKHSVVVHNLIEMDIKKCDGCLNCEEGTDCHICDDFSKQIISDIYDAELIIFTTPTYFNMPSASMVNFIDRTNSLCEYFSESPKKVLAYLSGQTDEDSIKDAYKCIHTYFEIMAMEEIATPIFHVARFKESLPKDAIDVLSKI
ncbi:MAG: flavodoxin family protein [Acutalibacteraceae bacterium]|nr:flavodoxin family protein [Acutalibacteraceae bacterium]